ncbi:large, multifunctional secreted protein [Polaribacter reichenbachii]|uniref:Large, multifunctional secreted protein n=1 Tax=Polaribacter reichenbachii TaxID=996801 RepID=A0A1B8U6J5_9FLAO|nr:auracyanin family protein [Polaribacter reichenbachii]APZ46089.1 large, multifunctional secreted protein [Polaribacter reichenbachii]AUC19951.1 auracyanin family protein [Polaribacter reichenbachii]OBY67504.1 large, multifunctional secreted protein [Polaribacter reichenbachii]
MQKLKTILVVALVLCIDQVFFGQSKSIKEKEAEFYKIVDVPIPADVKLEVGGLAFTDDDKLGVSTRRGEVWLIDKPYGQSPKYKLFANGLHEALGLAYREGNFYLSQRGELTKLVDKNGDDEADLYKTIFSWPLSGNYHDYSYGPKFTENGDMIVTLNLSWQGGGKSTVRWRGWMLKITQDGKMTPIATGLRSPAGFNINPEGDIFYTENQGDWVGSGRMTHLEVGDFAGHPEGLKWSNDPLSPLTLKPEDIEDNSGLTLYEYSKKEKEVKAPAIWLPHTILGISTSDILYDTTKGKFGPFEGQQFIGDQGHSKIMRVYMEKVNGVYQGAAFPFREGFSSGILRMIWGSDNSMFVGMTSRGWASTGKKEYGLQRLEWTGKTPFEIKTMKAQNDGFELEFTKPINKEQAEDVSNYNMATFTYKYYKTYGSPIVDQQKAMIHKAEVSEDGLTVKLTVHGMRLGFIHQLEIPKLTANTGEKLLHKKAYYTLNEVPGGELKSVQMEMKKSDKKIEQPKRTTSMPHEWGEAGADEKVTIGTIPGLKYDVEEITISRNRKIELTLNNNDDMIHNIVITKQGKETPLKVGEMALKLGLDGPDLNYVPFSDLVIAHSGTVGPEGSETIYFTSPSKAGEYWIVCTFPGHSFTMRTKLIVK